MKERVFYPFIFGIDEKEIFFAFFFSFLHQKINFEKIKKKSMFCQEKKSKFIFTGYFYCWTLLLDISNVDISNKSKLIVPVN